MITQEQIPTVLGHPVYDKDGAKIGEAEHVFVDDVTGQPDWITVRTGMLGRSESFVPIRDATLIQDHLQVPFSKSKVKDAPSVDVESGGHLSVSEEERLYHYYGMTWDQPRSQAGTAKGAAGGAGGAAGTAEAAGGTAGAAGDTAETRGETTGGAAGAAGMPGGLGEAERGRAAAGQTAGMTDDAMTRSEEELRVGVERRPSGRARLRKYVVTEHVQKTVPVRHEEVRVEREPITDENIDQALSGPEITEAEHEVTLHEERPVVETETVPKERVRLTTEEYTEEETVEGDVRKERIEGEVLREPERGDESQR